MIKKLFNTLLVVLLVLPIFGETSFIYADDEEEVVVEKSNYEKCIEDGDEEACILEAKTRNSKLSELEKEIADASSNIRDYMALADKYYKEAQNFQKDIDNLKAQITELEKKIEELQKAIAENIGEFQ